eukprot:6179904-Pleurochrysis_carterae.AAC.2
MPPIMMRTRLVPSLAALLSSLVLVSRQMGVVAADDGNVDALAAENAMLKLRLNALKQEASEMEPRYSYVVVKGYIAGAQNVYMETMGVDEAKQYCNSNPKCKGFTFNGPHEHPEDEVTVAFKGGSKVAHDVNWISYVKESSMFGTRQALSVHRLSKLLGCQLHPGSHLSIAMDARRFRPLICPSRRLFRAGALHGAMQLDEADNPAVIKQGLTFESICIVFALGLSVAFLCRRRCVALLAGAGEAESTWGSDGSSRFASESSRYERDPLSRNP